MPDENKRGGLWLPQIDDIDMAQEVACKVDERIQRLEAEAAAMRDLRARLDTLADGKEAIEPTRDNIVALIRALSDVLRPATQVVIDHLNDGTDIVINHPAVNLLDDLDGMVSDLDIGKTDPALKAAQKGANRSYSARDARARQALIECVEIVQQYLKVPTRLEAENHVAKKLNRRKRPLLVDGKQVTSRRLKGWRNHRNEWKR